MGLASHFPVVHPNKVSEQGLTAVLGGADGPPVGTVALVTVLPPRGAAFTEGLTHFTWERQMLQQEALTIGLMILVIYYSLTRGAASAAAPVCSFRVGLEELSVRKSKAVLREGNTDWLQYQ